MTMSRGSTSHTVRRRPQAARQRNYLPTTERMIHKRLGWPPNDEGSFRVVYSQQELNQAVFSDAIEHIAVVTDESSRLELPEAMPTLHVFGDGYVVADNQQRLELYGNVTAKLCGGYAVAHDKTAVVASGGAQVICSGESTCTAHGTQTTAAAIGRAKVSVTNGVVRLYEQAVLTLAQNDALIVCDEQYQGKLLGLIDGCRLVGRDGVEELVQRAVDCQLSYEHTVMVGVPIGDLRRQVESLRHWQPLERGSF